MRYAKFVVGLFSWCRLNLHVCFFLSVSAAAVSSIAGRNIPPINLKGRPFLHSHQARFLAAVLLIFVCCSASSTCLLLFFLGGGGRCAKELPLHLSFT